MVKVLEVIETINQIAHLAYDGALDEDGEPKKVGLKREEGHPILDSRVMDGFNVHFEGNKMKLNYQTETVLRDVYKDGSGKFEEEMVSRIDDIVSFLKKEYRKVKKESLTLKMQGEPHIRVQHVSNYKTWAEAYCIYEIGGVESLPSTGQAETKLRAQMKKWIGGRD
ncbi:MAG: hypothetical protein ACFFKA_07425 [Candidatus Thorarchaeota archaeon]